MKRYFLAVCIIFALSSPAFSQMGAGMGKGMGPDTDMEQGMGMAMDMDKMDAIMGTCIANADKIGLSNEQLAKLKVHHAELLKKRTRFRAEQKVIRIDLKSVLEVKDFDIEKAKALVKQLNDMKQAHYQEMLLAMKEARAILTDEQFQKLKTIVAEKMGQQGKNRPGQMNRPSKPTPKMKNQ